MHRFLESPVLPPAAGLGSGNGARDPHVFPAPDGNWGDDAGPLAASWRRTLPVTNGGMGVALNVMARLLWPTPNGTYVETVPTSMAAGASTNLTIDWLGEPVANWKAVSGAIHYNDVDNAFWETTFRIYADTRRHKIEVTGKRMVKLPDGTVIA